MPYAGMSACTGAELTELEHVRQSVLDIFMTRKGTRTIRRAYGSGLPGLVDRPITNDLKLDIAYEAAEAIDTWEPRLSLKQLVVQSDDTNGRLAIDLDATYFPRGHLGDFTGATREKLQVVLK